MKEVVIVGGGASGLIAAIVLKQKLADVNVTIVERLERVGKKILATGSGKANFTNSLLSSKKYNNPAFVEKAFEQFGYVETIDFFKDLGLLTTELTEGRVYPKSELSSSLLDVMRNRIKDLKITEKCNFEVKKIALDKGQYVVESTRNVKIRADYVVLATGGKSSPVLGSNGTGYLLAKSLKLKVTDTQPGLVGIKTDDISIKGLEGVRVKGEVKLFVKKQKQPVWNSKGEIQFKHEGISGIVVMEMASFIARNIVNGKFAPSHIAIDLCPEYTYEELLDILISRRDKNLGFGNANFLTGIFHKMITQSLLKKAKIEVAGYVNELTNKELERLAKNIKEFTFPIKCLDTFDHSQVTVGGVEVGDLKPETLESKKSTGIYVCGELLNIDGDCGGYNLQWAWTSGYIVGKAIAERINMSVIFN